MSLSIFFDEIRSMFPAKRLKPKQVEGMETIIKAWQAEYPEGDDKFLAYLLATAYHETAHTMQPIKEYGGARRANRLYGIEGRNPSRARRMGNRRRGDGARYMGRGYVQLTWKNNYRKAGLHCGIDLIKKPHLAMQPDIAAKILIEGCMSGWFTGSALTSHIDPVKANYRSARRVVNGNDKALMIARYAKEFESALRAAGGVSNLHFKNSKEIEEELYKDGSRTIKATKSNDDAGKAVIGVGVGSGIAEAVTSYKDKLKEASESLSEYRAIADAFIDFFVWAASYWWVFGLAAGGLVLWNNKQIIKARISDEPKIGRLADD
ncbi:MAG: hypothetical protein DHS20C07_19350 [Methyloligella sp.]|nr:MAG: hypothetical protein DHS20C07_19350 [Methyloligella sp.]